MYDFPQIEAEAQAAIESDAARVKAEVAARAAKKAKADAETAEHQARIANPELYFGLHVAGRPIVYALLPMTVDGPTKPKKRTLDLDGINVEHVFTDADGVWIYREM